MFGSVNVGASLLAEMERVYGSEDAYDGVYGDGEPGDLRESVYGLPARPGTVRRIGSVV
jgi:hypothetical protein